jgi:hypothetical protein
MSKMTQGILFAVLAAVTTITLSACGNSNGDQAAAGRGRMRMPDFGQPERPADIMGLVESVVGNEVTLLKIERPQRPDGASGDVANDGQTATEGQVSRERTRTNAGGDRPGGGNMMFGPGGGAGMRGGPGGGSVDGDAQAAMLERMKEMSSGKVTVIVPVGIQMLKFDTSAANINEGPKMVEATIADIKKDKMVNVWLDETASGTAAFVMVMR